MTALYNENDGFAADWLENLIAGEHIAHGRVDRRSIKEVVAEDLVGVTQAHFFAGIGVWSYALRLAGWPDDAPVWTGSCPCQPYSAAGKRKGKADARHLWPAWCRLIGERRPPVVFGEQVASVDGRAWLDDVLADLEGLGFAVAAADLCSAGVGAPHRRQRLFFAGIRLADADRQPGDVHLPWREPRRGDAEPGGRGSHRGLANAVGNGRLEGAAAVWPGKSDAQWPRQAGGLGDSSGARSGRDTGAVPRAKGEGEGCEARGLADELGDAGAVGGFWGGADWLYCRDDFWRPTQPGLFPMANGTPGRVGRLRASGNAIVPHLAATFVQAVMEAL